MARSVEAWLARSPGVRAVVRQTRDEIAAKMRANLAGARDQGRHQVVATNGATDAYAWLEGPAPMSVEFGRFTPAGTFVEGKHVIGRAL